MLVGCWAISVLVGFLWGAVFFVPFGFCCVFCFVVVFGVFWTCESVVIDICFSISLKKIPCPSFPLKTSLFLVTHLSLPFPSQFLSLPSGISRDSVHKRRATSGRHISIRKKRKFQLGRPPAMTKLGSKKISEVRCRGGNIKHRALRLDHGNFSWGSEAIAKKVRIVGVVYNASNNELVRTNTLVKNCIVQIDAQPFRQWYNTHYGMDLAHYAEEVAVMAGKKAAVSVNEEEAPKEEEKKSKAVLRKQAQRNKGRVLDNAIADQFRTGRLLACVSSRPGQSGRCDGYILEGEELFFYAKKLQKKKGRK